MPFPWILQRYIFRETTKTFLLAAAGLTGVVGLGGGVLNMIKMGEVTPGQFARLMALVLPLAMALTLPIAALFAAAATYGRLSADNEFVACRSSGINMHILFLPTVVISLLSASVCFAFTNFLVPGMVQRLNEFGGADVGALIQRRLSRPQGITLGGRYRISADESMVDPQDSRKTTLRRVAFVEVDDDQWVRFGTAREIRLAFDRREERLRVSGWMAGLSYYDRKLGQFVEEGQQAIPPNELPSPVPRRIKFLTISELLHYLSKPDEWYEVRQEMERLRKAVGRGIVYDALWDEWLANDRTLTLADDRVSYRIRSADGGRIPREGGIELTDVSIEERRPGWAGERTMITAERASVEVTRGGAVGDGGVQVTVRSARLNDGATVIHKIKEVLGPVAVAPELIGRVEALTEADLLSPAGPKRDELLEERRTEAKEVLGETLRRITGAISERMAFSVSVFVLVILGAALGIVFRGAHVMTAFGISFVPTLFVIITIVMGKQMSHNAATHWGGLLVMWGGIVIVAGLDLLMLTRVVRR